MNEQYQEYVIDRDDGIFSAIYKFGSWVVGMIAGLFTS